MKKLGMLGIDITKDILFAFVLIGAFFSRLLRYRKKWNDGKENACAGNTEKNLTGARNSVD